MKKWIKKFENVFISIAFAEMGEQDAARNMLGIKYVDPKKIWDDVFISVTFAEA